MDRHIILPGLSLGTLIQLQFEGQGYSHSILFGMDPGKFLIVQTPHLADLRTKLFMGNHGIMRHLASVRAYAFH